MTNNSWQRTDNHRKDQSKNLSEVNTLNDCWMVKQGEGGGGFATKPRIRFEFVWTHAQCMPTFRVNACAVHAWSLNRKHGDECARRLRVRIPRIPRCAAADFRGSFLSMWCRSLVFFLSFFLQFFGRLGELVDLQRYGLCEIFESKAKSKGLRN